MYAPSSRLLSHTDSLNAYIYNKVCRRRHRHNVRSGTDCWIGRLTTNMKMTRFIHSIRLLLATAGIVLMAACSSDGDTFTIEGRFLNMNQGEIYVYSTDGLTDGLDTITVNGGRFGITLPCKHKGTLVMVFPNFSEQPVFAEPGKSVDVKADASHLKEMTTKGTKDNELMNDFRQATLSASPPEIVKTAEMFIADHPESQVAVYLMRKYLMQSGKTEYLRKAKTLLADISKAQEGNRAVARMKGDLQLLLAASEGSKLPQLTAQAIDGRTVGSQQLRGKTAIVFAWASWSYNSENMARRVNTILQDHPGVAAIAISLDASAADCKEAIERDQLRYPTVCDGQLFESPLVRKLGIRAVPDNIILRPDGTIAARGVAVDDLEKYLK